MDILSKAKSIVSQYEDIMKQMVDPENVLNQEKIAALAKEKSNLEETFELSKSYVSLKKQLQELSELKNDKEYEDLVKEESEELLQKILEVENKLTKILISDDPNDNKNAIIEIRAGTGGDEAGLFASDLLRMYSRYAENNSLKINMMDIHETGVGGLKSATFSVEGPKAYGRFKYEGGVHRVQRIPKTESGGRVHTSAATVAVLPEVETAEVEINDSDIKVDTYRASGAGGQHVNKTESAIRLTHIPSGLVVTCQDESSQHKNKDKAMKVLRTRLYEFEQIKQQKKISEKRKSMVSTGDRSAKIRTYNFPQNRITDHRINITLYKLDQFIDGSLQELIDSLKIEEQKISLDNA